MHNNHANAKYNQNNSTEDIHNKSLHNRSFHSKSFHEKKRHGNKSKDWRDNLPMSPMFEFDKFSNQELSKNKNKNRIAETNTSVNNHKPKIEDMSARKYVLPERVKLNTSSEILIHDIQKLIAVERKNLEREQLEEAILPTSKSRSKSRTKTTHYWVNNSFQDLDKGTFKLEYQNLKGYQGTNTSQNFNNICSNSIKSKGSIRKGSSPNKFVKKDSVQELKDYNLFVDAKKLKENEKKYRLNELLDDETYYSKNRVATAYLKTPDIRKSSENNVRKNEPVNLYNSKEAINLSKNAMRIKRRRHATEAC